METEAGLVGNLTPRAASKRLLGGMVLLGVALAGAVALHELSLARWWRLTLILPFFLAANGLFMGLYRT